MGCEHARVFVLSGAQVVDTAAAQRGIAQGASLARFDAVPLVTLIRAGTV